MSYPSKRKGYRTITVDGATYRWRFDTDTDRTIITLQNGSHSGQQAAVHFTDLPDWWLAFPHPATPLVSITPRHVAALIRLALAGGWTPAVHRNQWMIELKWTDFSSSLVPSPGAIPGEPVGGWV